MIQNFSKDTKSADLINITSEIITKHPRFAFGIMTSFTQDRIDKEEELENIGTDINSIIQEVKKRKEPNLVPDIIVSDIIRGFVKGCLMRKPYNREDMQTGFSNLLKETGYEKEYNNLQEIIDSFYAKYKGNLKSLKKEIKKIAHEEISDDKKKKAIRNTFFYFILDNVQEKTKPELLIKTAYEIIINNPKFAFEIIDAFTQGCIIKKQKWEDIATYISDIIQTDKIIEIDETKLYLWLVCNIVSAFTQGYIIKKQNWKDIAAYISNIIKTDKIKDKPYSVVSSIISGFTKGCIDKNQNLEDIAACISEIINTKEIKNNHNLVTSIICSFTLRCNFQKKRWEDIAACIQWIIKNDKIKGDQDLVSNITDTFEQVRINSQYFIKPLTNSSNKQLSEEYRKQTGIHCRKKPFNEGYNGKITNSCYCSPQPSYPLSHLYPSANHFQPSYPSTILSKNGKGINEIYNEKINSFQDICYPPKSSYPSSNPFQYSYPSINPFQYSYPSTNSYGPFSQSTNSNQYSRPSTNSHQYSYPLINISNSAEKNNSSLSKRHKQQNQQDYRSRYK